MTGILALEGLLVPDDARILAGIGITLVGCCARFAAVKAPLAAGATLFFASSPQRPGICGRAATPCADAACGMAVMTDAKIRSGTLMASALVLARCYLDGHGSGQLC